MSADHRKKIISSTEIVAILSPFREQGKKIVLSHGCFDLVHPGHLQSFEMAKAEGDILVVTLMTDRFVNKGPGRPVFSHPIRAGFLAAMEPIDYVVIIDQPLATEAIDLIRPDVYVKGSEDGQKDSEAALEREAIEAIGGRLHFTQGETYSSSTLLNRHFDLYPAEMQLFLNEFRQKYTVEDVMKALESIRGLKVLIIGDAVVDEYHYVRPMGKTSKSNIIATRYLNGEAFSGGVFACANHLAGFCDNVHLLTVLGTQDTKEELIRSQLKKNVTPHFFYREDGPTTVKRRYLDANFLGKLFEVYFFEDRPMADDVEAAIHKHLEETLSEYDVVISLDYLHGLISQKTVALLSERAKFLAVNTQTNAANIGYNSILRYPKMDFACIDEPELRLATRDRFGAIEPLLRDVADAVHAKRAIVTRGHKGCLVLDENREEKQIPVLSGKVVDAVGAGDAFLAIAAPCAATGMPMELVGFIGNSVGAQAVTIVGNREAVEPAPLTKAIKTMLA
ncbi:MAG: PfkB family carbohydrate kinase [Patescibacteria group bacterium]|jgi:rfaE bifunctional protein nucleotidyltransferase chain/domain